VTPAPVDFGAIAGIAHQPEGVPAGVVLLTHGAGGSRESPLLIRLCDQWARRGWLAVRYNLPYRRRRPKGPPSGSAARDQEGIIDAVELAHTVTQGPVIAGGHSYGGRMTSVAVATMCSRHESEEEPRHPGPVATMCSRHESEEEPRHPGPVADATAPVAALTLFSYPLHPPGKPERARTEHLPRITVPTVFTHGTADPFGSIDELTAAVALIPALTEIVMITGARHDLGSKTLDVPVLAVDAALRQLRWLA
jgi:predicted alpha/beta-hydrolase family hydrolase